MKNVKYAPILIMIASSLWAVDAIFRTQLTYAIPTASIIFFEHLLGFLILSPIFIRNFRWIRVMDREQWKNFILLTLVSSVLGTILFTEALARSFAGYDFVTPILLQKLQPVFVVLMSAFILKEKITTRFVLLAVCALTGSYLISFGFNPVSLILKGKELVYLLSIGAAFCWGYGTILSKKALERLDFPASTALRFFLAIPISLIFVFVLNQHYDFGQLTAPNLVRFLIIAGITGGAGAIFLYYRGLQHTQAKISTFAELMYPVVSIFIAVSVLNPYGAPQKIEMANILGIIILLVSIILISFDRGAKGLNTKKR